MAMAPSSTNQAVAVAAAECTICLGEFGDGDDAVRVMPVCRHRFHASCIQRWLAGRGQGRRSSCPTCRAPVAVATAAAATARSAGDGDCAQHVAFAILAGLQLIAMVLAMIEATMRYYKGKK